MKQRALASFLVLAALALPRAAAAAYDLCDPDDRDEIAAETSGIRIDSISDDPVVPGSGITIHGEGFDKLRPFHGQHAGDRDLNLHIRFLSLEVPPGESKERWVEYSQRSFAIVDDGALFVDVPRDIHGSRGSLSIESDLPTRCENPDGTVWHAHNFGFGWIEFDLAPPDPQVEPITDLRATQLATGEVRLQWTDVAHERGYRVLYRQVGTLGWFGIGWIGGRVEHPAGTTSVTFDASRLDPPEAYELMVSSWNYSGSAESNIVAFDGRSGQVTIQNSPRPLYSTLCNGTEQATQLSALFDQDWDGEVSLSGRERLPYPLYPVADISLPSGYWNQPGGLFASRGGVQANLIVVAQFYGCGLYRPHFVAAHMRVEVVDDRLVTTPVLLLAGDELNEIFVSGGDPIRGVVMEGTSMDVGLDEEALLNGDRATGFVSGGVAWGSPGGIAYGASIGFTFDVPVLTR